MSSYSGDIELVLSKSKLYYPLVYNNIDRRGKVFPAGCRSAPSGLTNRTFLSVENTR